MLHAFREKMDGFCVSLFVKQEQVENKYKFLKRMIIFGILKYINIKSALDDADTML